MTQDYRLLPPAFGWRLSTGDWRLVGDSSKKNSPVRKPGNVGLSLGSFVISESYNYEQKKKTCYRKAVTGLT
jgi:hypothetical protein